MWYTLYVALQSFFLKVGILNWNFVCLFVCLYLGSPHRSVDGLRIRSYVNPRQHFRHRAGSSARNPVSGILQSLLYAYYPGISHRASLADLQLICKPTVRLCNQRLWVYLQKSFLWREPYQTHCGDTFATDLAFRSRCIPTECHRWRCRLIPCVQGALGDFFTHHCPIADWRHALQCRGRWLYNYPWTQKSRIEEEFLYDA